MIFYAYGPEPQIWPEYPRELRRIIERHQVKIAEQRPRALDVNVFSKDRQNKVEAEIAKVQKKIREAMYPTWHDSLNNLTEESNRSFIGTLDPKLEACKQRMTMLKQISKLKGKAAAESVATGTHLHFMLYTSQRQLGLTDNNCQLPYYSSPQFDKGSSSYMFHLDPNLLQKNNEVGEGDQWSGFPTNCYNGMQFRINNNHPAAEPSLQNIPSQNIKYEAFNLPTMPQGLQPNSFYHMLQAETLNSININK